MNDNEPVEILPPDAEAAQAEIKSIRAQGLAHPANDRDHAGYQKATEALSLLYAKAYPPGLSRDAVPAPFLPAEDAGQRAVEAGMARAALDTLKARGELDTTDPKQQRAYEAEAASEADTAAALPEVVLPNFWERGEQEAADEATVVRVFGIDPLELRGIVNQGHQDVREEAHTGPVDAERATAATWEMLRELEGPDVDARFDAMQAAAAAELRARGGPALVERVTDWLDRTNQGNNVHLIRLLLRRHEGRG